MIKNLVFDFGDVILNLDKNALINTAKEHNASYNSRVFQQWNAGYEVGAVSTEQFLTGILQIFPMMNKKKAVDLWNSMLLDLPVYRFDFLKALSYEKQYRLFLLSNTNALHIAHIQEMLGAQLYNDFLELFEGFYLSYEIGLRKPNTDIFDFLIKENALVANETLFIDDTLEHIVSADKMGLATWHLQVGKEDVTDLFKKI